MLQTSLGRIVSGQSATDTLCQALGPLDFFTSVYVMFCVTSLAHYLQTGYERKETELEQQQDAARTLRSYALFVVIGSITASAGVSAATLGCPHWGWVGNGGTQGIENGLCGFYSPTMCWYPHIVTFVIMNMVLLANIVMYLLAPRRPTAPHPDGPAKRKGAVVYRRMHSLSTYYVIALITIFGLELLSFILSKAGVELPDSTVAAIDWVADTLNPIATPVMMADCKLNV